MKTSQVLLSVLAGKENMRRRFRRLFCRKNSRWVCDTTLIMNMNGEKWISTFKNQNPRKFKSEFQKIWWDSNESWLENCWRCLLVIGDSDQRWLSIGFRPCPWWSVMMMPWITLGFWVLQTLELVAVWFGLAAQLGKSHCCLLGFHWNDNFFFNF